MRTIIIIFLSLFCASSFAQLSNFDNAITLASSDQYEYKNPVFDGQNNYAAQSTWLSYERYKANGASDIILQRAAYNGFVPEVVLTSAVNDSNTNQSIYNGFIAWESNKDGNRNIYYATSTDFPTWSAPDIVPGSTDANETQPYVTSNTSSYYVLAFKRGPDIIFKRYKTSTSTWEPVEYNLSDSISEDCSLPIIVGGAYNYAVCFIKHVSDGVNKLVVKRYTIQSGTGALTFQSSFELDLNVKPEKMKLSRGLFFEYPALTFSAYGKSDTFSQVYILNSLASPNATRVSDISGFDHYSGKGVGMNAIRSATNSLIEGIECNAFGCISGIDELWDLTTVDLYTHYRSNGTNSEPHKYTVGAQPTKLDLSPMVASANSQYLMIWAVWEKKINGKSALISSYMTDILDGVNYLGTAVSYSLKQNYPNPFNPVTKIEYEIPVSAQVELKVYNTLGKEVASLVNQQQTSGKYNVDFNAGSLSSGIYFYTLKAGEFTQTRKMLLVK